MVLIGTMAHAMRADGSDCANKHAEVLLNAGPVIASAGRKIVEYASFCGKSCRSEGTRCPRRQSVPIQCVEKTLLRRNEYANPCAFDDREECGRRSRRMPCECRRLRRRNHRGRYGLRRRFANDCSERRRENAVDTLGK